MGLEALELLLAVEDSFKLSISDEEAQKTLTAGQLYSLVLSKLEPAAAAGCLTSYTFYKLRSAIADRTGQPRRQFSPKTPTASVLPRKGRREAWQSLGAATGLRLPSLIRPRPVTVAVTAIPAATFVAGCVWSPASWQLALSAVPLALAAAFATKPLATTIPRSAATLGQLTQRLTARNFATLADQRRRWREADVWESLRTVIAEILCVDKVKVTKEARFVEDLGI